MERTTARLRWSFKRVADWERDQTVSRIDNKHGPDFQRNMNVADKFASEWSLILDAIHRTETLNALPAAVKAFVTIPVERRLSPIDNRALLEDFSE